jgi:hypothetical protein
MTSCDGAINLRHMGQFLVGGNNDDLTLAKFRCEIWQLSGLADRAKLLPASFEAEKTLAADKEKMEELRTSIANSPHLAAYTEKQAKRILAGGWSQLRKHRASANR